MNDDRKASREFILAQLKRMAEDETLPASERERALSRMIAFEKATPPPKVIRPQWFRSSAARWMSKLRARWAIITTTILWFAVCAAIYWTAVRQMEVCRFYLGIFNVRSSGSGTSMRCFVGGMQRRDLAIILALVGPFLATLTAAAWDMKNRARKPLMTPDQTGPVNH